jgi:hypothetical protein
MGKDLSNSLNRDEVTPEKAKECMRYYAQKHHRGYPDRLTSGPVLDENEKEVMGSWNALYQHIYNQSGRRITLVMLRNELLVEAGKIPASGIPEINPENVKKWIRYYNQTQDRHLTLNTKGRVLDESGKDTGIASWNALDRYVFKYYNKTLAQLNIEVLDEIGITLEKAKEWMKYYETNRGKYPHTNTKGRVLDENGDTGIPCWMTLNQYLSERCGTTLATLRGELEAEKQNNGGPNNATISPEPQEEYPSTKTIIQKTRLR